MEDRTFTGLLREAENDQGALKAGAFGGPGSGKTTTMGLLLLGVSKAYHGGAPVAMMDTERGSDFLKPIFNAEGVKLFVHKSRAFKDMVRVLIEAQQMGCCAFLMDSVTHTWMELVESWCRKRNVTRPEFHHWKPIKEEWQAWPDAYLNSPLHCAVCGRAGFEYEYQEIEGSDKKELIKGASKMKTESQFGYEPHVLIEIEAIRQIQGGHGGGFDHVAHVLKDRSWALNGLELIFPGRTSYQPGEWKVILDAFKPHLDFLNIGKHHGVPVRTSDDAFDANGRGDYARREQEKKIALEEIEGTMVLCWPGQDQKSKRTKLLVIDALFGVRSWAAVEAKPTEEVQAGLKVLRDYEQRAKCAPGQDTEEGVLNLVGIAKKMAEVEAREARARAENTKPVKATIPPAAQAGGGNGAEATATRGARERGVQPEDDDEVSTGPITVAAHKIKTGKNKGQDYRLIKQDDKNIFVFDNKPIGFLKLFAILDEANGQDAILIVRQTEKGYTLVDVRRLGSTEYENWLPVRQLRQQEPAYAGEDRDIPF